MQESDISAKLRQSCSSDPFSLQSKQLQPYYVSSYHLFSVKRLNKNISNNIFLVDLFYYWYLSGQSYNYLFAIKIINFGHW